MKKYIMALDQGTTSSRAILFGKNGEMAAVSQKEFTQYFPENGWVEQDPKEIWASQMSVMMEARETLGIPVEEIAAIGITNQRETTIVWNKETGEPIYPAIVWQCRRTADRIEALKAEGYDTVIREKTGLIADPYFSATKIEWILDHVEGARKLAEDGKLYFGTVDTWLIYKLTGGKVHATDYTNASRTMLFDIHALCWDQKILDYFRIPASMLPQVKPSSHVYGYANLGSLGESIPIAGAAGDQQAALFGQCCFTQGEVKNTYGTGCFMLMHTGDRAVKSRAGLLTTIAASADGTAEYALEGSVFVAGAAIQWLRDGMHLIEQAPQTQKICESVEDTAGTMIVPAFTGMGAPYWNPYARGMVTGLTRGCQKEHFIRAIMEAIAFQTMDVLTAMRADAELSLLKLKVDGGASANDFLMQFQADLLGVDVQRPRCIETTALGAAYLAGLAVGYWKDTEEIKENWQLDRVFTASMPQEKRQELVRNWKRAVDCALYYAKWEEEHD